MVPKKRVKKQTVREEKKSKLRLTFSVIFMVLFFCIAAVLATYFFVIPSVLQSNFEEKNIVIISDKLDLQSNFIYFAHISENPDDSFLLRINSNETVTVPGGYGEYPLQSVYPLLKIDKKEAQFIRYAYSQLLGISVDEVIALNEPLVDETDAELSIVLLRSAVSQALNFQWSDLSELLQVHYSSFDIERIELEKINDISDYYQDLATIRGDVYQYCSTAVINATGENGVATTVGELIEHTGGLVVRLDDADKNEVSQEGQVVLYYSQEVVDCQKMVKKIEGLFSQPPTVVPLSELENSSQYRAKVVVFIRDH